MIPTTSAKPSCRSELNGLNRNDAKLHAVIAAADEISPPVWPTAHLDRHLEIAAGRFFAEPGHQEHVVIHADGHQEYEQEVRDLPINARRTQDRDEHQMCRAEGEGVSPDHGDNQVEASERVAESEEEYQEDSDRYNVPALDLVRSDQRPNIGRLGVFPSDSSRYVEGSKSPRNSLRRPRSVATWSIAAAE